MAHGQRNRQQAPSTMLGNDEVDTTLAAAVTPPAGPTEPDVSPETPAAGDAITAAVAGRQGSGDRPFCPKHLCLLRAVKSSPEETSYKCPVPTCECKEKRSRPAMRIPAAPKPCPQRTCADNPTSVLEVVPGKSVAAHIHMQCPNCNFSVKQPNPAFREFATRDRNRRAAETAAENISER